MLSSPLSGGLYRGERPDPDRAIVEYDMESDVSPADSAQEDSPVKNAIKSRARKGARPTKTNNNTPFIFPAPAG